MIAEPHDDCIIINPDILEGRNVAIERLPRKGYSISGRYSGLTEIPRMDFECIPEVEVSFDPDYFRIGCDCIIQLREPYLINDRLIYLNYIISCGDVGSTGYEVIYKLRSYANYDVEYKELWFID